MRAGRKGDGKGGVADAGEDFEALKERFQHTQSALERGADALEEDLARVCRATRQLTGEWGAAPAAQSTTRRVAFPPDAMRTRSYSARGTEPRARTAGC